MVLLDRTEFSECCIGILKIFPERLKPNKPHHSQVQETSLLMTKSLRVGGLVLKPRVSPKNIEVGANDSHLYNHEYNWHNHVKIRTWQMQPFRYSPADEERTRQR